MVGGTGPTTTTAPPSTTTTTVGPTTTTVPGPDGSATWVDVEPGSTQPEVTDVTPYPDSSGVQFLVNGTPDARCSCRPNGFDATGPQDNSRFHIYPNITLAAGDELEARWTSGGVEYSSVHVVGGTGPTTTTAPPSTTTTTVGPTTTTAPTTTTVPPSSSGGITSDDFSGGGLDPRWTVVDPRGDGDVSLVGTGTSDARLSLSVPAGSGHDAWAPNESLQVLQAVDDTDLSLDAKFDSVPTKRYQMQGLIVREDADTWIRADYYHDGSSLRVFAASFDDGQPTIHTNAVVPSASSLWLRLERSGDQWSVSTSLNGVSWVGRAGFSAALTASGAGVWAGNATGGTSPAFTALVDYVADTDAPVIPEDPTGPPSDDTDPPQISGLQSTAGTSTATVGWTTDEPASSLLQYGTTPALGSTVGTPTLTTSHALTITGLSASTTYYVTVSSSDAAGNVASATTTFTTDASTGAPVIDVWYGPTQEVGFVGLAQPRINLVGNASGVNPITSLSYTVNGSAPRGLAMGPNDRRLVRPGDFNIDLLVSELVAGPNTVVITAVDTTGTSSTAVVTVTNQVPAPLPPVTTLIDWATTGDPTDLGTVVDGKWYIQNDELRTAERGYDRLVAIGDTRWTDYEVEMPVTVHSVDLTRGWQSGPPLIGFILRWNGHNDTVTPGAQPMQGWLPDGVGPTPLGAMTHVRWISDSSTPIQLWNHRTMTVDENPGLTMQLGVTYRMKARVETLPSGGTQYSYRVWPDGTPEPTVWSVQFTAGTDDLEPSSGSIVLVAHEADVSFGNVTITPAN